MNAPRRFQGELIWTALFGISGGLFFSVAATTIRVPEDFPTIGGAVNTAKDGDTILISDGTYTEYITLTNNITIASLNGPTKTKVEEIEYNYTNPPPESRSLITVSGAALTNVHIRGLSLHMWGPQATPASLSCSAISVSGAKCTISSCIIADIPGWSEGGGFSAIVNHASDVNRVIVENTTVTRNSVAAFSGIQNAVVKNCIIANNRGRDLLTPLLNCNVTNSTVYGNHGCGGCGCGAGVGGNWDSCVVWDNEGFCAFTLLPFTLQLINPASVSYSIVSSNYPGVGNLNTDPMFVDTTNGDFHLMPKSPAIDAGNPERVVDPDGSRADIGALPFLYQPWLSLIRAVKPSFTYLSVGTNYQLQTSSNLVNWINEGGPFKATNTTMVYPKYWDLDGSSNAYFRVQTVP